MAGAAREGDECVRAIFNKKKIKGIFGDELILAFWQMTVKVTKINIEHTYFHLFTITIYNALT